MAKAKKASNQTGIESVDGSDSDGSRHRSRSRSRSRSPGASSVIGRASVGHTPSSNSKRAGRPLSIRGVLPEGRGVDIEDSRTDGMKGVMTTAWRQKNFGDCKKAGNRCLRKGCSVAPTPENWPWVSTKQNKKDNTTSSVCMGALCNLHHAVASSFESHGEPEKVVRLANEDPKMNAEFNAAERSAKNIPMAIPEKAQEFYPQTASCFQVSSIDAIVRMRGVTPEQFKHLNDGITHHQHGRTLQLLRDPLHPNKKYQGLLVPDHPKLEGLGILYEFRLSVGSEFEEYKTLTDQCIRADQGYEAYSHLIRASGSCEPSEFRAARALSSMNYNEMVELSANIIHNVAAEEALAKKRRMTELKLENGALPSAELSGNDAAVGEGAAGEDCELQEDHNEEYVWTRWGFLFGSVKNDIIVRTVRPYTGGEASGDGDSLPLIDGGSEVTSVTSGGDNVNLCLELIASGKAKQAHKRASLEDKRLTEGGCSDQASKERAQQKGKLLSAAADAQTFSKAASIHAMSPEDFMQKITVLSVYGLNWPVSVAIEITYRRCNESAVVYIGGKMVTKDFFKVILPWLPSVSGERAAKPGSEDFEYWDPKNPLLSKIPGTFQEIALRFEQAASQYFFQRLIAQWSDRTHGSSLILLKEAEWYVNDTPDDIPDRLGEASGMFVKACRFVAYVVDAASTNDAHKMAFHSVSNSSPPHIVGAPRAWKGLPHTVSAFCSGSDFMFTKLTSIALTAATHEKAFADANEFLKKFTITENNLYRRRLLKDNFANIASWRSQCRSDSLLALDDSARLCMDRNFQDNAQFNEADITDFDQAWWRRNVHVSILCFDNIPH